MIVYVRKIKKTTTEFKAIITSYQLILEILKNKNT